MQLYIDKKWFQLRVEQMKAFAPPNVVLINISFNDGLEHPRLSSPSIRLSFLTKVNLRCLPCVPLKKKKNTYLSLPPSNFQFFHG